MEREPIWTLPNANGEQSVLDRVVNGLQPRIQMDMRSDETKALEVAHAMNMLREGRVIALDHNPLSLPPDDLAAVERAVIKSVAHTAKKDKKAGRPKKDASERSAEDEEENDAE